jgi:hypothetical protein
MTDELRELILADERVSEDDRCPCCHEDRVDWLVWVNDLDVRCESCGNVYDPAALER